VFRWRKQDQNTGIKTEWSAAELPGGQALERLTLKVEYIHYT